LDIDRLGVIGLSGGGPLPAAFATHCPERTAALVLFSAESHRWDAPCWLPQGRQWALPLLKRKRLRPLLYRIHRLQSRMIGKLPQTFLKSMCGPRYKQLADDSQTRYIADQMIRAALRCLQQPAGTEHDIDTFLDQTWIEPGRVQCPTLVIHDPLDPVAPVEHARWALAAIPGAQACELRLGGHIAAAGPDAEQMFQRRSRFLRQHVAGVPTRAGQSSGSIRRTTGG
jgi:pimeloyl-ACP methyl ester carboxylesterase